ncbi:MAG: hypothetical protein LBQ94_00165 [Treponema sp.]|jgi:hypothetical protein|nr:hypothetical protein [Treponema sp.]
MKKIRFFYLMPLGVFLLGAAGSSFALEPVTADPGVVLSYPIERWRDRRYEVFRWDAFPEILIFDTADYDVQDRLFKRLAFFVEKAGFRGRLAPDAEIAALHGWNAHDYRALDLANFFEAARKSNFPLLREERELETILLDAGILRRNSASEIIAGRGAIISLSRESDKTDRSLRPRFMAHEGFHGIYFIDEDFRNFSRQRWEVFPAAAKKFLLSFFEFQAYDTSDQYLVVNEFMAHVLQQSVAQAAWYFGEQQPNRMIATSPWRRASLPEKASVSSSGNPYWPDIAAAFTAEGEAFSRYVNQRWGLAAGRVWKNP